jgi:hypothetical protein
MYSLLVTDPDDVLAALAYTAYKQHESEVMAKISAAFGAPPTQAEQDAFYLSSSSPAQLTMYEDRAQSLINAFLDASLEQRALELERDFLTNKVSLQLSTIHATLAEKKSKMRYVMDVLSNLGINIVTIILIGMAFFGLKNLDAFNGSLSRGVGLPPAQEQAPASKLEAPPPPK